MFCGNCGQQVKDGAAFCPNCGKSLAQDNNGNQNSPFTNFKSEEVAVNPFEQDSAPKAQSDFSPFNEEKVNEDYNPFNQPQSAPVNDFISQELPKSQLQTPKKKSGGQALKIVIMSIAQVILIGIVCYAAFSGMLNDKLGNINVVMLVVLLGAIMAVEALLYLLLFLPKKKKEIKSPAAPNPNYQKRDLSQTPVYMNDISLGEKENVVNPAVSNTPLTGSVTNSFAENLAPIGHMPEDIAPTGSFPESIAPNVSFAEKITPVNNTPEQVKPVTPVAAQKPAVETFNPMGNMAESFTPINNIPEMVNPVKNEEIKPKTEMPVFTPLEEAPDDYEATYVETVAMDEDDYDATFVMEEPAPKFPKLVYTEDGCEKEAFINKDEFIVGRLQGKVDLVTTNRKIGRIHAAIITRGGDYFVKDFNSQNKTYINGNVIDPELEWILHDNDVISFADGEFTFVMPE